MSPDARRGEVAAPDGTRIAYSVTGHGPPLMLTNGLVTTSMFWKHVVPLLRAQYCVVTWDLPGHGASGPAKTAAGATIEAQPATMARILDALGFEAAVHVGWSLGSQVVLELYRKAPARVLALGSFFGPAEHALSQTRLPVPAALIQGYAEHRRATQISTLLARLARLPMVPLVAPSLRRAHVIGEKTSDADLRQILDDVSHMDPYTAPRMAASAQAHSASDVLDKLDVPLLILGAERDRFMPPAHVAIPMHRRARHSELLILEAATHSALLDFPLPIARSLKDFLGRRVFGRASA